MNIICNVGIRIERKRDMVPEIILPMTAASSRQYSTDIMDSENTAQCWENTAHVNQRRIKLEELGGPTETDVEVIPVVYLLSSQKSFSIFINSTQPPLLWGYEIIGSETL